MYRKRYEYAKLNSKLPKESELWDQGRAILRGYGFSDDKILEEFEDEKTGFRVDLAGISDHLKVCVEVGKCGPQKLFILKSSFDKVVWIPYWLTIIPTENSEVNEEIIRINAENSNLKNQIKYLEREYAKIHIPLKIVKEEVERIFNVTSSMLKELKYRV